MTKPKVCLYLEGQTEKMMDEIKKELEIGEIQILGLALALFHKKIMEKAGKKSS